MGIKNAEAERIEAAPREVEQMLGDVMLFEPVMIQNYLHDEFDRDSAPIAAIQHGAPIEFNINGATALLRSEQPAGACASSCDGRGEPPARCESSSKRCE